jgi:hypothetical protein
MLEKSNRELVELLSVSGSDGAKLPAPSIKGGASDRPSLWFRVTASVESKHLSTPKILQTSEQNQTSETTAGKRPPSNIYTVPPCLT